MEIRPDRFKAVAGKTLGKIHSNSLVEKWRKSLLVIYFNWDRRVKKVQFCLARSVRTLTEPYALVDTKSRLVTFLNSTKVIITYEYIVLSNQVCSTAIILFELTADTLKLSHFSCACAVQMVADSAEGTDLEQKAREKNDVDEREKKLEGRVKYVQRAGQKQRKTNTARGKAVSKGDGEEVGDKRRCEKTEEEEDEEENRQS
ncbi:hypothetical protein D9C73_025993 [Collichthys lucidus]|uniref:Uncharacterized protein n=1 Tax=Collichthys lucidus TaxID=240159 RepID=A0A4U5VSY4_COLLU|nr:hypothetical protein D9C73_025993 [Collichthys lucidus]